MSRYLHICVDTLAPAFDDRLSEELSEVLNAPSIINRLCESEAGIISLETTQAEPCGSAWVSSDPGGRL